MQNENGDWITYEEGGNTPSDPLGSILSWGGIIQINSDGSAHSVLYRGAKEGHAKGDHLSWDIDKDGKPIDGSLHHTDHATGEISQGAEGGHTAEYIGYGAYVNENGEDCDENGNPI